MRQQIDVVVPSVLALGYLELGASDLGAWKHYAQQVLGVACIANGQVLQLRFDAHAWRICLTPTGEDDIRCAGFEVASTEDLRAIRARLEAQGVETTEARPEHAASRRAERVLLCRDPFGLQIELYVGDRIIPEPFTSPAEVTGFVTAGQGLGHIVLTVADLDRANTFYQKGLGFRISDHILLGTPGRQIALTFLHCNPRHHSLALAPVPAPKRLNHIMLELASIDDVGRGLDRANTAGVRISSSLGRHTNDRMLSFYMQTPSGFDVEYGHGGVEIDETTWRPETYHAPSLWGHRGGLN